MFTTLRSRIVALLTGIVVLTVLAVGVAAGAVLRDAAIERANDQLRDQARYLARAAVDPEADLATTTRDVEELAGVDVTVAIRGMPGDGVIDGLTAFDLGPAGDSVNEIGLYTGDGPRPWTAGSREGWPLAWTSRGRRMIGYAAQAPGTDVVIVVARPRADVVTRWRPIAFRLAMVLAGALLAAWAAGLVLSWRLTRPLLQLVGATNDIARGRFPRAALEGIPTQGEIGELGVALTEMAGKLREVDSRDRRFLMSISHELRTPLTAIAGHAQALEDGVADDPEMRSRSLAVIRREAGRLDRLVEDIIDLARLRSNRFNTVTESVYLDELGEHLMAIFEDRAAHPGIEVRGDFEHVNFHSDGQRILQILRNLVNNGLRYARTEVVVTGERVRGRIRLTVMNDGEPIDPEMQERIFEPFVGSKREGGMGLGLAIGRELSWALGGNLRCVPSTTGAVFELTLPLEPPGSGR